MKYYKVLKLVNGDDVIGLIDSDNDDPTSYRIEKPLTIYSVSLDSGATALYLKNFTVLPKSETITIYKSHVISTYTPNPTFIDFYDVMAEYIDIFSNPDTVTGATAATFLLKEAIKKKLSGETTTPKPSSAKKKVTH